MRFLRFYFLGILLIFLVINFIFDFKITNIQTNDQIKNFVYNYILPHKNTVKLEKQIKELRKDRNQIDKRRILYEEAFQDLMEDRPYLEYDSLLLEKLLTQFDPYEFDISLINNSSNLEYSYNSEHSFSNNTIDVNIFGPTSNIFMYGIANQYPGSGYLEIHNDNLIIISASGILGFSNIEINNIKSNLFFQQIKTNISEFIGIEQFKKSRIHDFDWLEGGWFSVKDIEIYNDEIYVSYTREVSNNCWNTSLIYGKMNYQFIEFDNFFTSEECVHFYDNIDEEFNAHQSGGRVISLENDKVYFSTGDFRSRHRTQKIDSMFGKIIEIDKVSKNYKVISMGHRNPQGLYYNKEDNFLIEAEHGPQGGDEINIIKLNQKEIPNYGWAISSYGEHYGGANASYNQKTYEKYPLYKSHSDYGFIEPIKYFVPSIGISQIVGLDKKNHYVVASLKDSSLYFFELKNNKEIINMKRIEIGERIRDMIKYNNELYLFLEDTASFAQVILK